MTKLKIFTGVEMVVDLTPPWLESTLAVREHLGTAMRLVLDRLPNTESISLVIRNGKRALRAVVFVPSDTTIQAISEAREGVLAELTELSPFNIETD